MDHICCVALAVEPEDDERHSRKAPCHHTAVNDGDDDDSQPFESPQSLNRRSLSLVGHEMY